MDNIEPQDEFIDMYNQIMTIISDPKSYENIKNYNIDKKEKYKDITDLLKEYSKSITQSMSQSTINPINLLKKSYDIEQSVKILKNILTSILPQDIKLDYSDLESYIKKYMKKQKKQVCKKFIRNNNYIDKYIDKDDRIKSSDFLNILHCKSCNHGETEHISCNKYIKSNSVDDISCDNCDNCGLCSYKHAVCESYDGIDEDCKNCGLNLLSHKNFAEENMISNCQNYQTHPLTKNRCKNCIFNETHHRLTEQIHKLNKSAKDKIIELMFIITSAYISMKDEEKEKYYEIFYDIIKIVYI
jgi:hypothetical protein